MYQDRLLGLVLLGFSALLWWVILPAEVRGFEQGLMPRLVTLLLTIGGLGLCWRPAPGKIALDRVHLQVAGRVIGMMALYLLYLIAIPWLGFFTASALISVVTLYLLGARHPRTLILTPLIMLGSIWLCIVHFLHYPLPQGLAF